VNDAVGFDAAADSTMRLKPEIQKLKLSIELYYAFIFPQLAFIFQS